MSPAPNADLGLSNQVFSLGLFSVWPGGTINAAASAEQNLDIDFLLATGARNVACACGFGTRRRNIRPKRLRRCVWPFERAYISSD